MAKQANTSQIGIQVGVVPYRWRNNQLQVCLITSRRGHWGFPKGNIDPDESLWQAAVRECFEEAGVRGRIEGPPFVIYKYQKANRRFDVSTYLMQVDETFDNWPEANDRQRVWVSLPEARQLIHRVGVCEVMERAVQHVQDFIRESTGEEVCRPHSAGDGGKKGSKKSLKKTTVKKSGTKTKTVQGKAKRQVKTGETGRSSSVDQVVS